MKTILLVSLLMMLLCPSVRAEEELLVGGFSLTLPDGWVKVDASDTNAVLQADGGDCRLAVYQGARNAGKRASGSFPSDTLLVGELRCRHIAQELPAGAETVIIHIYTTSLDGYEYHFAFAGTDAQQRAEEILTTCRGIAVDGNEEEYP